MLLNAASEEGALVLVVQEEIVPALLLFSVLGEMRRRSKVREHSNTTLLNNSFSYTYLKDKFTVLEILFNGSDGTKYLKKFINLSFNVVVFCTITLNLP